MFFAISGFYMALVLTETYTSKKQFFISRAIRIYVPYFAILISICAASIFCGLASGRWLALEQYANSPLERNGLLGIAFTAATNLTIFCQDWIMFLKHDFGEQLKFTANFADSKSPLWHYLVIPQSWSVALELTFYSLAPFLNGLRTFTLVAVMAISVGLRTYLYNNLALNFDPWTYRLFPCELSTFLIGMLGYRIYTQMRTKIQPHLTGFSIRSIYGALLALLLIYAWTIKQAEKLGVISYVGLLPLMAAIPVIFIASEKSRLDRFIGELSYPVYLLHGAIVPLGMGIVSGAVLNRRCLGPIVAVMSIGAAIIVSKVLIGPLEEWRKRFKY